MVRTQIITGQLGFPSFFFFFLFLVTVVLCYTANLVHFAHGHVNLS